jgi:phenylalanine-4-hydroxylase
VRAFFINKYMTTQSKYEAKLPDVNGYVNYTDDEHRIWRKLYREQEEITKKYSCNKFRKSLEKLGKISNFIPQLNNLSDVLREHVGWTVEAVPALINFDRFFNLLANKKFPVATFIRNWDDLYYIQEPDIFHEVYGHCTMLTSPMFAEFVHAYGVAGNNATHEERVYLARLFWFTVEFGLIREDGEFKAYGAGLNSSPGEIKYSATHPTPERREFSISDILRTPYRIDKYQTIYYVLDDFEQLMNLGKMDLLEEVHSAMRLGDFESEL